MSFSLKIVKSSHWHPWILFSLMVYLEERACLPGEKDGHLEYQEESAIGTLPWENGRNWEREKEASCQLWWKCCCEMQKKEWLITNCSCLSNTGFNPFLRTYSCDCKGVILSQFESIQFLLIWFCLHWADFWGEVNFLSRFSSWEV